MAGTTCNPVLPIPITATRFPSSSIELSYTAVWQRRPAKECRPSTLGQRHLLESVSFGGIGARSTPVDRVRTQQFLVINKDFSRIVSSSPLNRFLICTSQTPRSSSQDAPDHLMVKYEVLAQAMVVDHPLDVFLNLSARRVELIPVWVFSPAELRNIINIIR